MLRWISAIPLALLVALSLFSFMAWMVDNGVRRAQDYQPVVRFDMLMTEKPDPAQRRQRSVPERPKMPEVPQVKPLVQQQAPVNEQLPTPVLDTPSLALDSHVHGIQIDTPVFQPVTTGSSRQAIALYKVQPKYPARALRRNIEGSVTLQFDIDESGRAGNIRVIESHPKRIFDRAARKAISRWKFKPRIVAGKAVKQPGMTQNIKFEIEK